MTYVVHSQLRRLRLVTTNYYTATKYTSCEKVAMTMMIVYLTPT